MHIIFIFTIILILIIFLSVGELEARLIWLFLYHRLNNILPVHIS